MKQRMMTRTETMQIKKGIKKDRPVVVMIEKFPTTGFASSNLGASTQAHPRACFMISAPSPAHAKDALGQHCLQDNQENQENQKTRKP